MNAPITITTLVENSANVGGVRGEHGLAFLLRIGHRKLLFDTGQSDLFLANLRHMSLSLEGLEAIVLSHGHYDHTGGLELARQAAPQARLFLHPAALAPKFTAQADGSHRSVGMKASGVKAVGASAADVVWTTRPTEIMEGIFVTGEVPRGLAFEDTGGSFFLDEACAQPDRLLDDQALYFDTPEGLVVVLGCAHSGAVNTLEYIRTLTGGRPIRAVIGGLHLLQANSERIEQTLAAFRRWDIPQLALGHCTGLPALAEFWTAFPGRCTSCPVGTTFVFPSLSAPTTRPPDTVRPNANG